MDTYLNVYKGYYVSTVPFGLRTWADICSLPETVQAAIMRATTGFVAVSMMWSMSQATDSQQQRLKQLSLNIVSLPMQGHALVRRC